MPTEVLQEAGPTHRLIGLTGEKMHEDAKTEVANRQETLAAVSAEIEAHANALMNGELELPDLELDPVQALGDHDFSGVKVPEDQIPGMFRDQIEVEVEEVKEEALALHKKDLAEAEGNEDKVHLEFQPNGVAGRFNGTDAAVDPKTGVEKRVIRHELGHAEVGLPPGDLDAPVVDEEALKKAIEAELEETPHEVDEAAAAEEILPPAGEAESPDDMRQAVARNIAATMKDKFGQTARGYEERWAMKQEGKPPEGPYLHTHWKDTEAMRTTVESAGADFEAAFRQAVHQKDYTKLREAAAQAAIAKAGLKPATVRN